MFSTAFTALCDAWTDGVTAHGRPSKSDASAASRPDVFTRDRVPANETYVLRRSSFAQRRTCRFVLAVSVTTAPSPRPGAISSNTPA